MKRLTLINISDKLIELTDKQNELYPKFYMAELKFNSIKAKIMLQQYPLFGSQPSRDAAVQELLEQTPEYEEYHKLFPEVNTIEINIRIYMQLSKNLVSQSWEVGNG